MKKPYNNININPELGDLLIPGDKVINTQPNSVKGNYAEYTKDGIRVPNEKGEY